MALQDEQANMMYNCYNPRNKSWDVSAQDQTTPPIDTYFARSLDVFTIAADTGVSGITVASLIYTFTATAGHPIVIGDEIILLCTETDKSLLCKVLDVVGDLITIDRPIDHNFEAACTLGRTITTNMAVDGSVTPVIFSARAGVQKIDFTRFIIKMISPTSMDDGRFGGGAALDRGFVFRIVNSFQKTIFNFKTNGEIANFCFDVRYADKAPAGQYGFTSRISFGGQSKHGVVLRIGQNDVIQWVVQDDLTANDTIQVVGQGHEVD
jgi:hypothetical protein